MIRVILKSFPNYRSSHVIKKTANHFFSRGYHTIKFNQSTKETSKPLTTKEIASKLVIFSVERETLFKLGTAFCTVNLIFCGLTLDIMWRQEMMILWKGIYTFFIAICCLLPLLVRWIFGRRFVKELAILPSGKEVSIKYYGLFRYDKQFTVPIQIIGPHYTQNDEYFSFKLKDHSFNFLIDKKRGIIHNNSLLRQILSGQTPSPQKKS